MDFINIIIIIIIIGVIGGAVYLILNPDLLKPKKKQETTPDTDTGSGNSGTGSGNSGTGSGNSGTGSGNSGNSGTPVADGYSYLRMAAEERTGECLDLGRFLEGPPRRFTKQCEEGNYYQGFKLDPDNGRFKSKDGRCLTSKQNTWLFGTCDDTSDTKGFSIDDGILGKNGQCLDIGNQSGHYGCDSNNYNQKIILTPTLDEVDAEFTKMRRRGANNAYQCVDVGTWDDNMKNNKGTNYTKQCDSGNPWQQFKLTKDFKIVSNAGHCLTAGNGKWEFKTCDANNMLQYGFHKDGSDLLSVQYKNQDCINIGNQNGHYPCRGTGDTNEIQLAN